MQFITAPVLLISFAAGLTPMLHSHGNSDSISSQRSGGAGAAGGGRIERVPISSGGRASAGQRFWRELMGKPVFIASLSNLRPLMGMRLAPGNRQ
jgi:hypothetical protein